MNGPLSALKTSTASTAIPLLADGTAVHMSVESLAIQPPEGNRAYSQVKIKLVTKQPYPDSQGNTLNPGFPFFQTFPLGSKEDPGTPPSWVGSAVARFQDACLGTGDANNPKGKPARPDFDDADFPSYIGKELVAIAKIKQSKDDQYGPSNQLSNMQHPADTGV